MTALWLRMTALWPRMTALWLRMTIYTDHRQTRLLSFIINL
jgi:hypothetical protein